MGNGTREFNVTHALAAYARERHFHAAFFTHHTTMLQSLVFSTQAFVILDRTKYFRAEKTVSFRLESTIINGFRLFHFAKRPGANHVRRSEANTNEIKFLWLIL